MSTVIGQSEVGNTIIDAATVQTGTVAAVGDEEAGRICRRDGEQSRAHYSDGEGFAERGGQRLFYEL